MKRIVVIGGGSIGERHVRCFQRTGRASVELCEVRDDVRQRLARDYKLSRCFEQFDQIPMQEFDAAVICTPANLHVSMALRLAEGGIGILIEKPLSTSLDGIGELQTLVVANRIPVSLAYVTRHHPALREMKQTIDSGRFGKPVQLIATGGQHFPFYRPAYRQTYYTAHETGGGAIQDALTHTINAAEWLVGPVTRLVVDAEHCLLEGVDVEDTVHLMTRHTQSANPNCVLGSFSMNQHQAVNESTLTVICQRGIVRMEGHNCRWMSASEPDSQWTIESEFQLERDDLFTAQADAFLDQLSGSSEPACSLEEGLQTLKVNLAALKSLKTSEWVTL